MKPSRRSFAISAASLLLGLGVSLQTGAGESDGNHIKLSGFVHRPDGQPAAGLPIRLVAGYVANESDIKTDASGKFEIDWDSATMPRADMTPCVFVRDVEHNLAAAQDFDDDKSAPMDLKLEPAITIVAKAESGGKPLTNATGALIFWTGRTGVRLANLARTNGIPGQFEIPALPVGRKYGVVVTAGGYGQKAQYQVVNPSTEAGRVDLDPVELKPATLKLSGQVVDSEGKPVADAWVNLSGEGQPSLSMRSGSDGSFSFEHVCEGSLRLYGSARSANGSVSAEGGETNVTLQVGAALPTAISRQPAKKSFTGNRLPDLASVDLDTNAIPQGKPVLLCLFDAGQRPSRAIVRKLQEQAASLKEQGITVLGVQAAAMADDAFDEWKRGAPVSFPLGRVSEKKVDLTRWAANATALPWLILADGKLQVVAEGFAIDDLDTQLKKVQ